jgi:hypothetical protein
MLASDVHEPEQQVRQWSSHALGMTAQASRQRLVQLAFASATQSRSG